MWAAELGLDLAAAQAFVEQFGGRSTKHKKTRAIRRADESLAGRLEKIALVKPNIVESTSRSPPSELRTIIFQFASQYLLFVIFT
jgi:hypothetical protein